VAIQDFLFCNYQVHVYRYVELVNIL